MAFEWSNFYEAAGLNAQSEFFRRYMREFNRAMDRPIPAPAEPATDRLVKQQAAHLAADVRQGIERQLSDLNQILAHVGKLQRGGCEDKTVVALLKTASGIIDSARRPARRCAWRVIRSRILLFKQAQRLLPKERHDFNHPPAWTEP